MTHERYSTTDDWELENPSDDVRGRTVVDAQGGEIGTISDMLVDSSTHSIDGVVLDSGRELPMSALVVEADVVRVQDGGFADTSFGDTGFTGTTGYAGEDDVTSRATGTTVDDTASVRLHEEDLQARTRRQEAGSVVVDKDVVEEQQSIDVPVTHEEVVIRRRPVGDTTTDDAAFTGGEDTIRVPVMEETAEVTKQTRVAEEIEISKRPVTETQRVSDTVRRETVDVREEGDIDLRRGSEDDLSRGR